MDFSEYFVIDVPSFNDSGMGVSFQEKTQVFVLCASTSSAHNMLMRRLVEDATWGNKILLIDYTSSGEYVYIPCTYTSTYKDPEDDSYLMSFQRNGELNFVTPTRYQTDIRCYKIDSLLSLG